MTDSNGNTLKYRMGQVEDDIKYINKNVDEIRTNHLPHIHTAIELGNTNIASVRKEIKSNKLWNLSGVAILIITIIVTKLLGA